MRDDRVAFRVDGFQLGAEIFDVRVNRAIHARVRVIPDDFHELIARKHDAGTADEGRQDFIFVAREVKRAAEIGDLAFRLVDRERLR